MQAAKKEYYCVVDKRDTYLFFLTKIDSASQFLVSGQMSCSCMPLTL